jgi:hypothetical protein
LLSSGGKSDIGGEEGDELRKKMIAIRKTAATTDFRKDSMLGEAFLSG